MQEFTEPTHILWDTDFGIGMDLAAQTAGVSTNIKRLREYDGFDEKTRALVEHGNAFELFLRLKGFVKE